MSESENEKHQQETMRRDRDRMLLKLCDSEPVASPQATITHQVFEGSVTHPAYTTCHLCPSAAQPAAGTTPRKFRKKPVVVHAFQFTGVESINTVVKKWCGPFEQLGRKLRWDGDIPIINTWEGEMSVRVGDWIIKGSQNGEYYACKQDIFERDYEPAE